MPDPPALSVTISVVNHQQEQWLRPCLTSLVEHPYTAGPSQIVVLDNASGDGSVERVRADFPGVRVMAERRRRGFGANHGLVIAQADTDLVLLLNPDALMAEGTLDRLVEAFRADDRVVVAGGPILDPDGSVWRGAPFDLPTPAAALKEALGLHRAKAAPVAPAGISTGGGWLSGSALMLRRSAYVAAGGFDPRFFMYFEETDLCKRLTEAGGLIAFHAGAPVTHVGRTAERGPRPGRRVPAAQLRSTTEYERSGVRYMRKHHGLRGALAYRASLAVGGGIRLLASFTPAAGALDARGDDLAATRARHRRRIAMALRPSSGLSFADSAAEYNRVHHDGRPRPVPG